MRRLIPCSIAAVVLAAAVIHAQQTGQFLMPMFDATGASVATFAPADLEVFEDGKPAKVLKVEPRDAPVSVTLALDNGRMMGDVLVHVRAAAKEFFNALPPGMEAALVTTAPQPRFNVKPTKDRAALLRAVDTIAPDSSGGRAIEALQDMASDWKKLNANVTPIMVLLASTFSPELINERHHEEGIKQVQSSRAVIHVVMFKPAAANEGDAQMEVTQQYARTTRGRFEEIGSHLQLGILAEIGKELAKTSGRQFLVTIQRPEGATGRLGPLSMSPAAGLTPGRITRMP